MTNIAPQNPENASENGARRVHTLAAGRFARLRVGLKWDPLERDDLDECYSIGSVEEARDQLAGLKRDLARTQVFDKILRRLPFLNRTSGTREQIREGKLELKKALETYIRQGKLPSYDLDLCCITYDAEGRMVEFIDPTEVETRDKQKTQAAFMHSGDHTTGTSTLFDEELLVNLSAIHPDVRHIFFVALSVNHSFDKIKGGFWAVINPVDEKQLLSCNLSNTTFRHRAHVMAKLSRQDDGNWTLEDCSEYCPLDADEKIPLHQRVERLVDLRYWN